MPSQRDLAIRALRNAQQCLDICLRGKGYRKGLTYAVHYTRASSISLRFVLFVLTPIRFALDVCAAFAASLLVRLARIFPSELDLRQTARDVEELAKILASGSSLVSSLRSSRLILD